MKNLIRKLLSVAIAFCLAVSLAPSMAAAEGETTHTVTLNLTNITAKDDDSSDVSSPVTVIDSGTFTAMLSPEEGYTLPESIRVSSISANNGTLPGMTQDGTDTETYYNKSSGKLHLAGIVNDITVTAAAEPGKAVFTVKLEPTDGAVKWSACGSVTFNIILTQTAADAVNGAIQTIDFSIGFDQNMTFNTAAAQTGTQYTVSLTGDNTSHVLRIYKNDAVNGITVGVSKSVTLGTVTFTMPSGSIVDTNGKYRLADFWVLDGGKISTEESGTGVCPTAVQYSSDGLYVMNAYLTMPADYAALHVSGIRCKVGTGEYTTAGQGTSILFPYGEECAIQITADTGYSLNTGSAVYTMADGTSGTFTYVGASGDVYTFSTADNKDLAASGTLTFTTTPLQYNIIYDENGGTAVTDGSYNTESTDAAFPVPPTKASYTFAGWKVTAAAAGGTGLAAGTQFAANAEKADISGCYGDVMLQAQWTATPNALTVVVTDANASAKNTASITPVSGIGGAAGSYTVTVEEAGVFTVTPSAGYMVTDVSWSSDAAGTGKTALTADESDRYTLPASGTGNPVWLFLDTQIDSNIITASAEIATDAQDVSTFRAYSIFSGTKTLVKFHAAAGSGVNGLALNGITIYKTQANEYQNYEYVALMNIPDKVDKTAAALNEYLETQLMTASKSDWTITYNNDVNLSGGFHIDDISVEYDFSSRSKVNWTPDDMNLLIGDVNHDGVLDSADLAAMVAMYNSK